jgi:hypothetical protein
VFSGNYQRLLALTETIAVHPYASRALHAGSAGTDVRGLQHALNHRLVARRRQPIKADGHYGAQTERAKHYTTYRLGFPHSTVKRPGATKRVQELVAHPGLRPASYKQTAAARTR